jgi:lipoate-protein ligase A
MDRIWRVILDKDRSAAMNMALDEALHVSCVEPGGRPTLRLYGWTNPSLSLGYSQRTGDVCMEYCQSAGVELVRRPTGGRAVLHGHDVTFSISVKEHHIPEGCTGIRSSHKWLMAGIVEGLKNLNLQADLGADPNSEGLRHAHTGNCFAHTAECDVRVGAVKAVGAAQVRRYGALLQQGSVPVNPPKVDVGRIFTGPTEEMQLPIPAGISKATIHKAIVEGFQKALGIQISVGDLTPREIESAESLAAQKYCKDEWTFRLR